MSMESALSSAAITYHEGEVPYFTFPALSNTGRVRHAFSTRRGGVSPAPFNDLNLGTTTKDEPGHVAENRARFERTTSLPLRDMIALTHGTDVHYVKAGGCGEGTPRADAIVTDQVGVPLSLFYADCCPVFLLDTARPALGLVHAGWRGTVSNVVGSTLQFMHKQFGTRPQDCLAAIASSIGPCCFEVDWDVAGEVVARHPQWQDLVRKISNKWTVDLWELNTRLLQACGVARSQISVSGLCTACREDLFFSFRRDQRNTGRLASACTLLPAV